MARQVCVIDDQGWIQNPQGMQGAAAAQPSICTNDQSPASTVIATGKIALMVGPVTLSAGVTITVQGAGKLRIL